MKLRKDRIFIGVSIVFLLTLLVIYTYRLIYYYNLERNSAAESTSLYEKIISSKSYTGTQGLFEIDEEYIFRGEVTNNYIYYSGRLWRIVSINKEKELKMVTDEIQTSLVWGINSEYKDSYIREWLNKSETDYSGIFNNSLNYPDLYLLNTPTCTDKYDSVENITCEEMFNDDKITLLTGEDYTTAGGANSYLNNEKNYWLNNTTTENNAWFITESGGFNNIVNINETYESYGVRPVITIYSDTDLISGNGSYDDPYIFENEEVSILENVSIGKLIKYNNYLWKAVSKDSEKVKLVLNDYVNDKDKDLTLPISEADASFNVKDKKNIAYYLNNVYDDLENEDYIIKSRWYTGQYNSENKFNYKEIYDDYVSANIGLLSVGELFINDLDDTFLITKTDDIFDTFYLSKINGNLDTDIYTSSLKVRPSLYLDSELKISAGNGTADSPYELSR